MLVMVVAAAIILAVKVGTFINLLTGLVAPLAVSAKLPGQPTRYKRVEIGVEFLKTIMP
jgi:hypothetical protein